jgi:hypothetical protein
MEKTKFSENQIIIFKEAETRAAMEDLRRDDFQFVWLS